ncbi:MAG: GyrI-like domain-containing protein [Deltaproteobacteria bacterium]|jgi:predicted transcriptional regulator YdeE|nr:GyrI-like domain-containing protein [Deltaproteobacteria bacterium]
MTQKLKISAIELLPERLLVGYCSILNSNIVSYYYNYVWTKFMERIYEIPGLQDRELYGVCTNLQFNGLFEYWTAVAVEPGLEAPADLTPIPLGAGTYGSRVDKPARPLPMMYGRLGQYWQTPDYYVLNWKLPCYELYKPDWYNRAVVKICIPLHLNFDASRRLSLG